MVDLGPRRPEPLHRHVTAHGDPVEQRFGIKELVPDPATGQWYT